MNIIFKDYNFDKPFENPLENIFFIYYLRNLSNQSYDFTRLFYDSSYLQNVYHEYLDNLIEFSRPEFPPDINVEEFDNKKVKDITKPKLLNAVNSFILYRQNLIK